jgi:mycothiol synthase
VRIIEVTRQPDHAERARLIEFVERIHSATGERPLNDHSWLALHEPSDTGYLAVTVRSGSGIEGLAQISATNSGGMLEVATESDDETVVRDLVETAVDAFRRVGGGHLTWWTDRTALAISDLAVELGLVNARHLYEMRAELPLGEHATITTRGFRSSDVQGWLKVNNQAFAAHPEQGGWTAEMLASRMAEEWFDPDGLRIHEDRHKLIAFCWTKVDRGGDPATGEIYVIAVDPAYHGRGLGRQLTLAGLDWIAARGIELATLFVDGDNSAGMHLYDRLGFTIHRTRTAFTGTLDPISLTTGAS